MRQVRKQLESEHGIDEVPFPSRATFHRLVTRLAEGRHATGSARTRRTLSQQPIGPFGAVYPIRPGELMQIDSTPLDVAVELDDGVVGRVELTALVDIATRSIPAAVIRPTTKTVDAALLLARCLTPELMRPGWAEAASMAASALRYRAMKSIDDRLAGAAAKPVIAPETIVCDHGKAYLSNTFKGACRSLGISLQPAHPDTPTDKPLVEIQDLLDEWIITGWQNRPHEGLRDPFTPSRVLTPNEKYAALLAVSGYVPVPLGAEEYLELMPAETRVINSYGVKIRHRVYDCAELNPYRGQKSGMKAFGSLWEVRYDPYDASCVWIRNHQDGGWITAFWRQLNSSPQPFGDDVWEHGRKIVAGRGTISPSEDSIKEAVDKLLDKASPPPLKPRHSRKDQRVAARNTATTSAPQPLTQLPDKAAPSDSEHRVDAVSTAKDDDVAALAEVIPLKIYNPQERADEWW